MWICIKAESLYLGTLSKYLHVSSLCSVTIGLWPTNVIFFLPLPLINVCAHIDAWPLLVRRLMPSSHKGKDQSEDKVISLRSTAKLTQLFPWWREEEDTATVISITECFRDLPVLRGRETDHSLAKDCWFTVVTLSTSLPCLLRSHYFCIKNKACSCEF